MSITLSSPTVQLLLSLPNPRQSAASTVVEVIPVSGGVDIITADGNQRRCLFTTVAKFRGNAAADRAREYLTTSIEGQSFSFISANGWDCDEWFIAMVRA